MFSEPICAIPVKKNIFLALKVTILTGNKKTTALASQSSLRAIEVLIYSFLRLMAAEIEGFTLHTSPAGGGKSNAQSGTG